MATKTLDTREKILDRVERLFLMGARTPWQVYERTDRSEIANYDTACRYLRIVQRRLRNRWKSADANALLRRELQELLMLEEMLWEEIDTAANEQGRILAIRELLKVKIHKARLLGFGDSQLTIKVENKPKIISSLWKDISPATKAQLDAECAKNANGDE